MASSFTYNAAYSFSYTYLVSTGDDMLTMPEATEGTPDDDILYGTSGDDFMSGRGGNDTLYGQAGNDVIFGGSGNDILNGGGGNDWLIGDSGKDLLKGGDGKDTFEIGVPPGHDTPPPQADIIADFKHGQDTIFLSHFVGNNTGELPPGQFVASTTGNAVDENDHVLYDTDSGNLYYDADGSGSISKVLIAKLIGHPTLTADDISTDTWVVPFVE